MPRRKPCHSRWPGWENNDVFENAVWYLSWHEVVCEQRWAIECVTKETSRSSFKYRLSGTSWTRTANKTDGCVHIGWWHLKTARPKLMAQLSQKIENDWNLPNRNVLLQHRDFSRYSSSKFRDEKEQLRNLPSKLSPESELGLERTGAKNQQIQDSPLIAAERAECDTKRRR